MLGAVITCTGRPMTPEDCLTRGDAAIAHAESPGHLSIDRVRITFRVVEGTCQRMNVEVLADGVTVFTGTGPCPST